jgi:hypothetical protein
MQVKPIITIACVVSSIIGSAFFAYRYGKESVPINTDHVKNLLKEIETLQSQVKTKELTPRDKNVLTAINKYGINNVIAMALNGRYECPSSPEQVVDRCDPREEISVMFATLNLAKAEKRTVEQAVYHKHSNGVYMFSWVPKIGNKDNTSSIFKHSLELAFKVMGGDNEVKQYDYSQEFYCRTSKSPCSWHKTSKNLSYLGRINLSKTETRQDFIREEELSYHTFWRRK